MRLARTIKIGGIKIGKQKVSQVFFKEILPENYPEIDRLITSGVKLEVVDADEAAIKDALKKKKVPEINGYPVKLEPVLKTVIPTGIKIDAKPVNVQVTTQAAGVPDMLPTPAKPLTAAQKKRLKAEEKKRKEAEKKKAAEEKEKAEAEEIGTPPPGA